MDNQYIHGRIYKLTSKTSSYFYFGSTTQSLRQRFKGHKNDSKEQTERKIFQEFTYEKFCENDIQIELVEEVIVHSKKELFEVEKRYVQCEINNLHCLNSYLPQRTDEEEKEYCRKMGKTYYDKNKDIINEKQHERYQKNKEKINEQTKKYYEKTKDRWSEYSKEYYLKNKDQLNAPVKCECGGEFQRKGISRHKKSIQHQNWEALQNNN